VTPAEIRALAEAATPGPWAATSWTVEDCSTDGEPCAGRLVPAEEGDEVLYRSVHVVGGGEVCHVEPSSEADARYIAAFSPERAIDLLDRLDAAEREVERLREAVADYAEIADAYRRTRGTP
jgi:hypothetical protein